MCKCYFRLPSDWSDVESQQSDVSVNNKSRRYRQQRQVEESIEAQEELGLEEDELKKQEPSLDLQKSCKVEKKNVAERSWSPPTVNTMIANPSETSPINVTSVAMTSSSHRTRYTSADDTSLPLLAALTRKSSSSPPLTSSHSDFDSAVDVWRSQEPSLSSESLEEQPEEEAFSLL